MLTFTDKCVASVNVVEFTVIPEFANVTANPAPLTKPVPTTVNVWLAAP